MDAQTLFLQEAPSRKRLRTSHACDVCRSRKIRCDGNTPCRACALAEQECTYGSEANSRGKTDLVLDGVLRIERFLHELGSSIQTTAAGKPTTTPNTTLQQSPVSGSVLSPVIAPSANSHSESPVAESARKTIYQHQATSGSSSRDASGLDNAVLESMHTSTTEAVLQWHHFDVFPTLRTGFESIFHLERSRPPLVVSHATLFPYLSQDELSEILRSFEDNANFWYPTASQSQLRVVRSILGAGAPEKDSLESCLALLVMALGCASQVTSNLDAGEGSLKADAVKKRAVRRKMGDVYFEGALKKLHIVHLSLNSTAAQCLFFVALYFAFLCRPLQAWEFISGAASKCLTLLGNEAKSGDDEGKERTRRIFWACYILESDYVAELSACPSSGIARIESSVSLPGSSTSSAYTAHATEAQEERSALYFLACISMRRLLNRVHQLLYARDGGAAAHPSRFPAIVAELQHQLDDWRAVLPPSLAFSVDTAPAGNAASGFLRQRYLTCRSVIYRPYLMWVLRGKDTGISSGGGGEGSDLSGSASMQEVLKGCKACLDACLLHILNLHGFSHTVLVDTWICSLSMAGAMLIMLAACRDPRLRKLMRPDTTSAGEHLQSLLPQWQELTGAPASPSVNQSIRIIEAADAFLKEAWSHTPESSPSPAWHRIEL